MRLMIVGNWRWQQYELAFSQGLENAGTTIIKFSTDSFFAGYLGYIQSILPFPGPALIKINCAIIKKALDQRPSFVLFWRPTYIFPRTVKHLRKMGIQTLSYNNDDPFGSHLSDDIPWHHRFLWFWYLQCLPYFNKNFFYRDINCREALQLKAQHAEVLLPYFIPWQDRPVILSEPEQLRFNTDIVFVGHYESDGREQNIRALIQAGIRVKIWGGNYWTKQVLGNSYECVQPIVPVVGDDYAKALSGAKICLAFLSKLNRDSYTRRCFEIPACGRVMLAERTNDLLQMFKEDEEACFFSNKEELVKKAKWLMDNPDVRERIAQAGLRRVWADEHDVMSRAKQFYQQLETFRNS